MAGVCSDIIEDIEDLISSQEISPKARYSFRKNVTLRAVKKKQKTVETAEPQGYQCDSIIPGTQTIFIKTWGCTHNTSDSEYMAGQIQSFGYKLTDEKEKADLWLLNSCTVKNPAEDHFRNDIQLAQKLGKYVVVAGCVPQGAPKSNYLKGLSIIGVQQIDRVVEVIEETIKGNSVRLFGQKKQDGKKLGGASLDLPKIRKNPLIEIIPINTGCLNQCTYCKTKHARGNLGSYSPEEIVLRAKQSFDEGVVELWLTSEDTGTYGRDIGVTLPDLLWKIIEVIPEKCKMRIGMTNPPYIQEYLSEIAKILSHPKVYSFLHIPVQSGSDAVLGDMKREYSREEFENVVDTLRKNVPGITIATDIICGFPTETEEDFEETMTLCEKYKFPSLFINQFYPRPGTPAARMAKIPPAQVKNRTKRLTELFQSYETYSHKVGEIQEVLITEEANDNVHYVGHNKFYEQVLVPKSSNLMGQYIKVRIVSTKKHCLISEILDDQSTFNSVPKNVESKTKQHVTSLYPILFLFFVVLVKLLWFLFV
ncbi:threonylcarbamoyladenosine tRNA methylthiotransferase [Planococcus citri]|uniref:threonylcarbamoyladenosine tRNA methylthiotransferase n=1 Tax=Planococcus citri TaxID=170843 RepID=UPI0031F96A36